MNSLIAVVMAGGRSERMRITNGGAHKALVELAGLSLLERSVLRLLKRGMPEIVVVSAPDEPRIADAVRNHLSSMAREHRAHLRSYIEARPLGNIGVVRLLADEHTDILVTYVDNVTSLDETALVQRHREREAAMTIATHLWPLVNPFGELQLSDGLVTGYREKPVRKVRISSGTFVVSPVAAAAIPPDEPFGASELCKMLLKRRLPVAAYCHDEPWVDVNDALALREAARLVTKHPERFQ